MTTLFTISQLNVTIQGAHILKDISVDVPEGCCVVIVGPNGCGKSTLLRSMAKLQRYSGKILIQNRDIQSIKPRDYAKRLALLPQSPQAPENLTVRDLVSRGRDPYRNWYNQWSVDDEKAVSDALEATRLASLAERELETLSGGQRQRAWFALTLAQSTDVLLLDEPTTYLDVAHQLEVLETVNRLRKERGISVVMVLHDLNMAARYADHILMMKDGENLVSGTVTEVLTSPLINEAFSIQSEILIDPRTNSPVLLPYMKYPIDEENGETSEGCLSY